VVSRLSLSYVPSLCLASAPSHCLRVVCVLCHMGLAACNKSSFVRFRDFHGQVCKRENKGRKYCAPITVITITGSITDFYRSSKRKI